MCERLVCVSFSCVSGWLTWTPPPPRPGPGLRTHRSAGATVIACLVYTAMLPTFVSPGSSLDGPNQAAPTPTEAKKPENGEGSADASGKPKEGSDEAGENKSEEGEDTKKRDIRRATQTFVPPLELAKRPSLGVLKSSGSNSSMVCCVSISIRSSDYCVPFVVVVCACAERIF